MFAINLIKNCSSVEKVLGEIPDLIGGLSTDTRTYKDESLFIALDGPSFKAVQFLDQVAKKKCPVIVAETKDQSDIDKLQSKFNETCFVLVSDSVLFLQQLSVEHLKQWRSQAGKKIIGITGSNGKTTHKEMLFCLLDAAHPEKVLKTYKSFNNHIGVPKTLLNIDPEIDYAVMEFGTNHMGELGIICNLAPADVGLITNIGSSHLEFFKSRENIFKEKRTLFDVQMKFTDNKGIFLKNIDDPLLIGLPQNPGVFNVSYGRSLIDKIHFKVSIESSLLVIEDVENHKKYTIDNENLTGDHNYNNLANCIILALKMCPDREAEIIQAARDFKSTFNRSSWIEQGENHIFLDAYNANPSSMEASIKGFSQYCRKNGVDSSQQYFIIGDMLELGEHASEGHKQIGALLGAMGAANISFVGINGSSFQEGLGRKVTHFEKVDGLKQQDWKDIKSNFSHIFIKGSRSLQLESLLDIK